MYMKPPGWLQILVFIVIMCLIIGAYGIVESLGEQDTTTIQFKL